MDVKLVQKTAQQDLFLPSNLMDQDAPAQRKVQTVPQWAQQDLFLPSKLAGTNAQAQEVVQLENVTASM